VAESTTGRLVVLAVGARMVRGSRPNGPRPGDRSGVFPVCCPDGPSSGSDGPRWHGVVFFSL
jgi:hypothetical protein